MTDTITIPASRRLVDGDTLVVDPPEVRQIFFVSGIQFTRADAKRKLAERLADPQLTPAEAASLTLDIRRTMFPEGLLDRMPEVFTIDDGIQVRALHFNSEQNVLYTIEVTETKDGLIRALLTPGAIVVYGGHARFGRGPCFAPTDAPGDNWENGTDPVTTGLFRMGFPFIGIPLHEFVEHKYHAAALPGSEPRPTAPDSEPALRRHLGDLIPRTVAQMHVDPAVVAEVAELLGEDPASANTFWTFVAVDRPEFGLEVHVVVRAHWKDTVSSPADLGSIEPLCRVFCHFACSTFQHNFPVLRKFKQWTRRGDDRFAFWTTEAAPNTAAIAFIVHLMTAPGRQSGQLWDPWLTRAVTVTNRELRAKGDGFQLI